MGKNHFWINPYFGGEGDLIEIKVLNGSEAVVEKWKFNLKDKQAAAKVMNILKEKYGFEVDLKRGVLETERDLRWLKEGKSDF